MQEYKKLLESGMHASDLARLATLIISRKETDSTRKIVKYIEKSSLSVESISETIKNKAKKKKKKKVGFLACY